MFQNVFHIPDRIFRHLSIQQTYADYFIIGTKKIHFIRILNGKITHGASHISGIFYNPLNLQLTQCFTDRTSACMKFLCQFQFHNPLTRTDLMIHDLGPDSIHYTLS